MLRLYEDCADVMVWFLTPVEVISAFSRLNRTSHLSANDFEKACNHFRFAKNQFIIIKEFEAVASKAERIISIHGLKSADALQLAAALTVTKDSPQNHVFVSLDDKLRRAAKNEGFAVKP